MAMEAEQLADRLADDRPEWATRFERGARLTRAGASAEALFVVRRGRVGLFDRDGASGVPTRILTAGDAIGFAAVLTRGAHDSTAVALVATEALRIPDDAVAELAAAAPALMLQLATGLARTLHAMTMAGGGVGAEDDTPAIDPTALAPSLGPLLEGSAERPETAAADEADVSPLYAETLTCPACGTEFDATRVRVRALSALRRESDLRTVYEGPSPIHYGMDVCPNCAYAAAPDDWDDCPAALVEALEEDRAERVRAAGGLQFQGERGPRTGMVATLLALRCYELREMQARKRAGLLHRLAWMARELGESEQERQYLGATREAYETAYREDTALSEAAAVRVSYLLGELAFRLGDPREAIRWFERTVRDEAVAEHPDLQRLAHDRWIDARESMRESA